MRGKNTIQMNTATVIEAVQEYLDRRFMRDAPRVVNFDKHGAMFVVGVAERDDDGSGETGSDGGSAAVVSGDASMPGTA